ncbi:MAG: type II secretion system protein [Planctomycetota bacterium]|nr:type II secretion system protein [Planctomycetota bacterium]
MRKGRGMTMLEVLIVMGIIALLMSALAAATLRLRERAALNKTRALLEKVLNGLETYKLHFRGYPPHDDGTHANAEALMYYLSTSFRISPDLSRNEVQASADVGPIVTFEKEEAANGRVVDAWYSPLGYERVQQEDLAKAQKLDVPAWYDPTRSTSTGARVLVGSQFCKLYSYGPNRKNDGGGGDDLQPGK